MLRESINTLYIILRSRMGTPKSFVGLLMLDNITRRRFLAASLTGAGGIPLIKQALAAPPQSQPVLKKALLYSMLPEAWSIPDKFKFIADVGFDGVEVPTITDKGEVEAIRVSAEKTGVLVH